MQGRSDRAAIWSGGAATCPIRAQSLLIVFITAPLLERTARLLASFADECDSEGVVYWFGFEHGSHSIITTLVVPDADTTPSGVSRPHQKLTPRPCLSLSALLWF